MKAQSEPSNRRCGPSAMVRFSCKMYMEPGLKAGSGPATSRYNFWERQGATLKPSTKVAGINCAGTILQNIRARIAHAIDSLFMVIFIDFRMFGMFGTLKKSRTGRTLPRGKAKLSSPCGATRQSLIPPSNPGTRHIVIILNTWAHQLRSIRAGKVGQHEIVGAYNTHMQVLTDSRCYFCLRLAPRLYAL